MKSKEAEGTSAALAAPQRCRELAAVRPMQRQVTEDEASVVGRGYPSAAGGGPAASGLNEAVAVAMSGRLSPSATPQCFLESAHEHFPEVAQIFEAQQHNEEHTGESDPSIGELALRAELGILLDHSFAAGEASISPPRLSTGGRDSWPQTPQIESSAGAASVDVSPIPHPRSVSHPPSLEASPIPDLSESSSEGSMSARFYGATEEEGGSKPSCAEGLVERLEREPLELGESSEGFAHAMHMGAPATVEQDQVVYNTPFVVSELEKTVGSPPGSQKQSPEELFQGLIEAGASGSLPHSPGTPTDSYSADVCEAVS